MSKDTNTLLKEISLLKFCEEGDVFFWKEYLENISILTKSNVAIVLSQENNTWSFENEYITDGFDEEEKEELLSKSVECSNRALVNLYGYEKFKGNKFIVSVALDGMDEDKKSVIVLLIDNSDKKEFSNLIIRATLCRDIPLNYELLKLETTNNTLAISDNINNVTPSNKVENHLENILSLLNTIIYEKDFKVVSMKIVDELANKFNCNKVSLGWKSNDYIKTVSINQVEKFTKSSAIIKSLDAIFEESYEQDDEIFYPEDENTDLITYAHKLYSIENKLSSLYTFPIRVDDEILGVVSFEKEEGILEENESELIRLSLNYIAPTLQEIYKNDKNIFKKSLDFLKNSSSVILGPKHTLYKLVVITISLLLSWIVFGKLEYKVEAVANIQTDNILYISAPFDGIVDKVEIDVGDEVKEGKSLVIFDTQELLLKKFEINSDILKYDTEAEKARASRKLADMKISLAKKDQSYSSLKKVDYYLNQANIKAPFDGIIVEGDREKLLGSPFSKGDIILQVANPTDLYGKIKVLEEYIDEIKIGQIAQLNLLSRPDIYFDVEIEKIIPMAKVDDVNGNVFTIKVKFLDETQDWMRPGMSGIVKIQIEERSILWILTHKISDYFHMHIWW